MMNKTNSTIGLLTVAAVTALIFWQTRGTEKSPEHLVGDLADSIAYGRPLSTNRFTILKGKYLTNDKAERFMAEVVLPKFSDYKFMEIRRHAIRIGASALVVFISPDGDEVGIQVVSYLKPDGADVPLYPLLNGIYALPERRTAPPYIDQHTENRLIAAGLRQDQAALESLGIMEYLMSDGKIRSISDAVTLLSRQ